MADKKPIRWAVPEGAEAYMGLAAYFRDAQENLRQAFSQPSRSAHYQLPDGTYIDFVMNDVVDFIKITPPQMRLRPKGKPIVWDQIPPYERDEDGKLLLGEDGKATYELDFHSANMIEDPDVAGGYYCTISVINGISKEGLILPATFSVVPGKEGSNNEDYPGWSIKQGKRTITDGVSSYFVDGKTATLLIGADVDGDCTIYATDDENSISLKASVPIAEWFVLHTPRDPAPPGAVLINYPRERYKLKEIGTGEIRLITDDHYLDTPQDLVDFVNVRAQVMVATGYTESFEDIPGQDELINRSSSTTNTYTTWVEYWNGDAWVRHPDFPGLVFTETVASSGPVTREGHVSWDPFYGVPRISNTSSSGSFYSCTGSLPSNLDNTSGYPIVHVITENLSSYSYDDNVPAHNVDTTAGSKNYVEASRVIDAEGYSSITYPETLAYLYTVRPGYEGLEVTGGYIIMWMEYKDGNTYCLKCADTPSESIWRRYATIITFIGKNNKKSFNYPVWVSVKDFSYYDSSTIYYGKETGITP